MYSIYIYINVPAPSKGCLTCFRYRVSVHHPLGFKDGTPFEGAGICCFLYVCCAHTSIFVLFQLFNTLRHVSRIRNLKMCSFQICNDDSWEEPDKPEID